MVLVAAAGPAMNIVLAIVAALAFHIVKLSSGQQLAVAFCQFEERTVSQCNFGSVQSVSNPAPGRRTNLSRNPS